MLHMPRLLEKKIENANMKGSWIGQSFESHLPIPFPYCKCLKNTDKNGVCGCLTAFLFTEDKVFSGGETVFLAHAEQNQPGHSEPLGKPQPSPGCGPYTFGSTMEERVPFWGQATKANSITCWPWGPQVHLTSTFQNNKACAWSNGVHSSKLPSSYYKSVRGKSFMRAHSFRNET